MHALVDRFVGDIPVLAEITGLQQSNLVIHLGSTKVIGF